MAQIWSNLRVSRMFLNQIIVEQLRHSTTSPSSCPLPKKNHAISARNSHSNRDLVYNLCNSTSTSWISIIIIFPSVSGSFINIDIILFTISKISSSMPRKHRDCCRLLFCCLAFVHSWLNVCSFNSSARLGYQSSTVYSQQGWHSTSYYFSGSTRTEGEYRVLEQHM